MTCQVPERIRYREEVISCYSEPLQSRLPPPPIGFNVDDRNSPYPFEVSCSALWRGYVGEWEISDNRLMLVAVNGTCTDGRPASLETVFPGAVGPVFADWYTGSLECPRGKVIGTTDGMYFNIHEETVVLRVIAGVVVGTIIRQNHVPQENIGPEDEEDPSDED